MREEKRSTMGKSLTLICTAAALVSMLFVCGCQNSQDSVPSVPSLPQKKSSAERPATGVAPQTFSFDKESSDDYKRALLLVQTMKMLQKSYVDGSKVSSEALFNHAMRGMVSALDPYSNYELPREHQQQQIQRTGRVVGIGAAAVKPAGRPITLIRVLPGTPAEKGGLRPGDQIIAIDGENILKLNLAGALEKLRGRAGTQVKLQIRRGNSEFSRTLTRKVVENASVVPGSVKLISGKIGYFKLTNFTTGSAKEVKKALQELKKQNAEAIIMDLRYNPGGLVDTAVNIASLLLPPDKVIFRARARDKKQEQTVKTVKGLTVDDSTPLIVLTNAFSASCSEILTGALQDHKRARVLGVRTFGKGTILQMVKLPGGGAVTFASSHYVTPGGRVIEKKGIMPDFEVRISSADTFRLATQTLRYPGALQAPHKGTLPDIQLQKAVALLQRELEGKTPRP